MDPRSIDNAKLCRLLYAQADTLHDYIARHIPPRFVALITPEDVMQEVWIAAAHGIEGFKPKGEDEVTAWIMKIAQCELADMLKSLRRLKREGAMARHTRPEGALSQSGADLIALVANCGRSPSKEVQVEESRRLIKKVLKKLSPDQRSAIRMRHIEGRSIDEITQALGKSALAVHGLLHRGLGVLRRRLGSAGRFFSDSGEMRQPPSSEQGQNLV